MIGKVTKYLICVCLGLMGGAISVLWYQAIEREVVAETRQRELQQQDTISVVWRQNHFILSKENLYNELVAQEVDFPDIVLAQAILETGHFQSYACVNRHNLFGLRKRDGSYMSFSHWTECVAAYKKYIQKWKHPPNDYYKHLDDLGYAEDTSYTTKLKQMVK